MPILGAHMSIAGGFYKAAEAAGRCEMNCVQIFTAAPQQWPAPQPEPGSRKLPAVKEIPSADAERFGAALVEQRLTHPLAHASYLINLASPDPPLWARSIAALIVELQRAERLGVPFVVLHPGSYTTSSEQRGLRRIAQGLDRVHRATAKLKARCLLENTAGQGSNLGWKFEHLAEIFSLVKDPDRLGGVCIDTCHAFAAGYAMGTEKEYKATMRQLNQLVGVKQIKAFHLNDSKREFGSRVDRHEHIGRGELGLEPFRLLLADRRFRKVPMYLETPKGKEDGIELDVINLNTLRGLAA